MAGKVNSGGGGYAKATKGASKKTGKTKFSIGKVATRKNFTPDF